MTRYEFAARALAPHLFPERVDVTEVSHETGRP